MLDRSLPRSASANSAARVLASWATVLLCACPDDVLQRLPEPEVQIDQLPQNPEAVVDILWVVDNSGSMIEEQDRLAANFDAFIRGLTTCQGTDTADDICDFATKRCRVSGRSCSPPDYHVGVIATDTRSDIDAGRLRRVGVCVETAGSAPIDGLYRYCLGTDRDCIHQPELSDSHPNNRRCDMTQAISFVTPTTPNAANAFARAVRVGSGGSGNEQGIRAAAMALGRDARARQNQNLADTRCTGLDDGQFCAPPAENAGFLRDEASLFVIFVADEDDTSFGQVPYFYRVFESLKGAGNDGRISLSAIVGDPDPDGASGPQSGGCPADTAEPTAAPGSRYLSLAMYSRSVLEELRLCDDERLLCPESFGCYVAIPDLPGACVPQTCQSDQDCGSLLCGDTNCFRCSDARCEISKESFLSVLEKSGIYGSICAEDYGAALDGLGFEAAGLARKFPLTKGIDCTKNVRCCEGKDARDKTCEVEAPICVKVNGRVIPRDRQEGWVFESGSNAIFFDGSFVPPTAAEINVAYTVAPTKSPIACGSIAQ